ncbi:hypothetical protein [Pseudodesulfovibrio sp. zrk46]|uniref:hypothetical protein n=1 Tax=Pseudodesulfovibrio sp. zrk46 TaxID=2725288 RepID=UPI001449E747|nr:hypothetical protein [Pseudodesulfovibrio sp. zrk46]QJB56624.1 hypothetical protein HFN16_09485 [Pseudodesulfovibrio sp. zrk46]
MAKLQYDFLEDSFLFDDRHINNSFKGVMEKVLVHELERYRCFCRENLDSIIQQSHETDSQLKTYIQEGAYDPTFFKQTALYLDEIVVADPLLKYSNPLNGEFSEIFTAAGVSHSAVIDRKELAVLIRKMKSVLPMVKCGYLRMTPRESLEEDRGLPLFYDKNLFFDVLNENNLSYYRENAEIWFGKVDAGVVTFSPTYEPSRHISIRFGDDKSCCMGYMLMNNEFVESEDDTRMRVRFSMPDDKPSVDRLKNWIDQSVNKTAINHYEQLVSDVYYSQYANANLLLKSQFSQSLVGSSVGNIKNETASSILSVDLPFLSDIEIEDLMNVRLNDGEIFSSFRSYLESQFRELRIERDAVAVSLKIDNIMHEIAEVKMLEIEQKARRIKRGALANVAIIAGSLATSVMTSGWSLLGALVATVQGYKTYEDYQEQVRENPCCFLWRVKNK